MAKSSKDMLAIIDENYEYLVCNQTYCDAFNLQAKDVIGQKVYDILSKEIFETLVKPHLDEALAGNFVTFYTYIEFPFDDKRYMEISYNYFYEKKKGIKGVYVNGRDHSAVRNSFDQLKSKNEMIKNINNQLIQSISHLEEVKLKLLESNNFLNNIAYIAAHDLKSPLKTVKGMMSLLKENVKESGVEIKDCDHIFEFMDVSLDKVFNLIDDLLDFARFDRDVKTVPKINLEELIYNVINSLKRDIKYHNAQINITSLDQLYNYSPSLIERLFQNLLHNAMKFKRKGVTPEIKIYSIPTSVKNHMHLVVQDNGEGIKEKHVPKIFDLFQRVSIAHSGNGIGLSTCKKIIDFYKGKIFVESEFGKGTKFNLVLPIHNPNAKKDSDSSS